jgi:hypothetical protein
LYYTILDHRSSYLIFFNRKFSGDTSAAVTYLQNGTASAPLMDTPPPNSIYSTPIAGSTQSVPSLGQMTSVQQFPVVQSTTQQQPPCSGVPPPTIVQQPCNIPPPQGAIYTGYSTVPPPLPGQGTQLPPPPNVLAQNCSSAIPQPCSSSSMATASIYQQQALPSLVTTTSPYFYPQATTTSVTGTQVAPGALGYHSMPPPLHHQTTYYDYTYMAPMISADGNISGQSSNSQLASAPMHHNQPPPPLATPMNIFPASNISTPTTNNTFTTNSNGQVIYHCNVMSPSLTSGFSGSGGDCKSTETSSILSTASFSSNAMHYNGPYNHNQHKKKGACNTGNMSSVDKINNNNMSHNSGGSSGNNKDGLINEKGFVAICEICRLPFPSQAVLENHLRGSRHARRVKSQQAFKQLHDNGAVFRHEEGVSEIRCEVCRVSVNSSHQLQAHLLGKYNFIMF